MNVTAHYNERTNVITVFCEKCGIPARIRALGENIGVDFMPEKEVDVKPNRERGRYEADR